MCPACSPPPSPSTPVYRSPTVSPQSISNAPYVSLTETKPQRFFFFLVFWFLDKSLNPHALLVPPLPCPSTLVYPFPMTSPQSKLDISHVLLAETNPPPSPPLPPPPYPQHATVGRGTAETDCDTLGFKYLTPSHLSCFACANKVAPHHHLLIYTSPPSLPFPSLPLDAAQLKTEPVHLVATFFSCQPSPPLCMCQQSGPPPPPPYLPQPSTPCHWCLLPFENTHLKLSHSCSVLGFWPKTPLPVHASPNGRPHSHHHLNYLTPVAHSIIPCCCLTL